MGPGQGQTRDPWICRQARICCQTRYQLRYASLYDGGSVYCFKILKYYVTAKKVLTNSASQGQTA